MTVDCGGGGDCFFRCIAHALWNDAERHPEVRAAVVEELGDVSRYATDFMPGDGSDEERRDRYLGAMARQGTYVEGQLELEAAARRYRLELRVRSPHGVYTFRGGPRPVEVVLEHEHYRLVDRYPHSRSVYR